jgi:glycosyltransferase involved in cell wall biosynthesis
VEVPIHVVPTGVSLEEFSGGDGRAFRRRHRIPPRAPLLGHVGRLAPEKNLAFLAEAAAVALEQLPQAWLAVAGSGASEGRMRHIFDAHGVADRVVFAGVCKGDELLNAYRAMDVFLFASRTETQGMVLVEALSTGCPVVAVDAPGAREVVRDGENGRLLETEDIDRFAAAAVELAGMDEPQRRLLRQRARQSAEPFDTGCCVDKTLRIYEGVLGQPSRGLDDLKTGHFAKLLRLLKREWELWSERIHSAGQAVADDQLGTVNPIDAHRHTQDADDAQGS